jgi:hypothetical protein
MTTEIFISEYPKKSVKQLIEAAENILWDYVPVGVGQVMVDMHRLKELEVAVYRVKEAK